MRSFLLALLFLVSGLSAVEARTILSIHEHDESAEFPEWAPSGPEWNGYQVIQATFPSAMTSMFPKNDIVWTRLVLPKGSGPFPVVMTLPILAGSNLWVESRFWTPLLERGIAVALVELPYQFHRRPPGASTGMVFLGRSPETLRANFSQAVLDVRRTVTWLRRRSDIDGEKVGVLGVSLGALVGSAAYAVDPRIKDAVFILGGAQLKSLLINSTLTGPILSRLELPEDRMAILDEDIEPLLYKDLNAKRPALLVNAWWDTVIPPANGRRLKEAFASAQQIWVPGGHYTSVVHLLWMPSVAARHFSATLQPK